MPLQLRRGPTADRTSVVPLLGELVYDTTTGAVFIGDGTTAGGVPITGFSLSDSRNATASLFLGPDFVDNSPHSGITFQYIGNRLIANVSPDLSNYTGTIRANAFIGDVYSDDSTLIIDSTSGTLRGTLLGDVKGSVFSDDSSRLIDGTTGTFNLAGTFESAVLPRTDGNQPLGNPSYKFSDVYLANSVRIGNATITHSGSAVALPAGSTVGGIVIAGNEGDFIGSVFGDDSSMLVDGTNASINLDGTIKGNAIPFESETYNLGSTLKKFNRLYLKENSDALYIGTAAIGGASGIINLPAGSTVGGVAIAIGSGAGDVNGPSSSVANQVVRFDGITGKLVKTSGVTIDDSNIITASGVIAPLTGNVIAADSTTIVNGTTKSVTASTLQAGSSSTTGQVSSVGLVETAITFLSEVYHDTAASNNHFRMERSRGTRTVPTAVQDSDRIFDLRWSGYDGTTQNIAAIIRGEVATGATTGITPGAIRFITTGTDGSSVTAMLIAATRNVTIPAGSLTVNQTVTAGAGFATGALRLNENKISTAATNADIELDPSGTGTVDFVISEQTTVGSAGAASALPATPSTYFKIKVNGVAYVVPAYAVS